MGIFGWSLPPGVSMRDIDPPDSPCDVCGQNMDECICPECPVCDYIGDEYCYINHGLKRTEEQKFLREIADRELVDYFLKEEKWVNKWLKEE